MIKVLHVVPNMQSGGLETFIMNVMRNKSDEIEFDFLVHYKERKFYDDEIEKLGGKIYRFSLRDDNNIFKYILELNRFFKEHQEYKIIHCHMESISFLVFLIAKKNNIKIRILHSHNIDCEKNFKGRIKYLLSKLSKYNSTYNLACSKKAGKYLFGKRKFSLINNAIDFKKFRYNLKKRRQIRKELNIKKNTTVIGHIGRFCNQKNHSKVIEIFYEYQKINSDSVLVLVGEGQNLKEMKEKAKKLNILDKVKFLGVRKDTDSLYCAFDVFLFPSLFEGLGIVLIEAQASGLYCYTSKKVVPKEAKISNRLKYIDLDLPSDVWAKKIIKDNNYDRKNMKFTKNKDNYDINKTVRKLEKIYKS